MGLRHLTFPEATVAFPGGEFAVRGLCLDDISILVQRHGSRLQSLFTEFSEKSVDLDVQDITSFAIPLLKTAPEIVAELIAAASDAPEDADVAARLPFPVQIDALEKLANLTFDAAGGVKKLLETVLRVTQGTTGLLDSLRA